MTFETRSDPPTTWQRVIAPAWSTPFQRSIPPHDEGDIMRELNAARSGIFRVGGEIEINRLGFGAMRITGPGILGAPLDRPEVLRTLRRTAELGVNFIDTADSYGPGVSEPLIKEALAPYPGILVATKAGLAVPAQVSGNPEATPTI